MKKRILALILAVVTLLGLLPLSGCREEAANADDTQPPEELHREDSQEPMTRGEWVAELGQAFGMDTPVTEEPYFSDVTAEDENFRYVQAAADWGVLSAYTDETFQPDEPITREEAAIMAAIASGWTVTEDQFGENGRFDGTGALSYAEENGILAGGAALDEPLTFADAEAVTQAAQTTYLNPTGESVCEAVFEENVVDMADLPAGTVNISGSTGIVAGEVEGEVTYDETGAASVWVDIAGERTELKEGGVIIAPATLEHPEGIAYKISRVNVVNGQAQVETVEPEIGDVYEELYLDNVSGSFTPDRVVWEDGVTATQLSSDGGTQYHISLLGGNGVPRYGQFLDENTISYRKDFHFGDGKVEKNWSSDGNKVEGIPGDVDALEKSSFRLEKEPSIEDFGGSTDSWKKDLKAENKFSGGYSIDGTFEINALTVRTDFDYKKFWGIPYGIKHMKLQVDSSITSTLNMQGNLQNELKIGTVHIPLGAGVSVGVDLVLYVNASGELDIKAVLSNQVTVEYSEGSGVRATKTDSANVDADVAINVKFGAKLGAALELVGVIDVIDATVDVGGLLEASAHVGGSCEVVETQDEIVETYEERMNILCNLYVPLITVSVGGDDTLAGKIGLSKSWDLMTKENAKKFTLVDRSWTFWSCTRTLDKNGEVVDEQVNEVPTEEAEQTELPTEPSTEPDASQEGRKSLNLTTYSLSLTNEPKRLELDVQAGEEPPAVNWSSSDTGVAVVDSTGLVTPRSEGSAIITVSLQEDPSVRVQCLVYVQPVEELWVVIPAPVARSVTA